MGQQTPPQWTDILSDEAQKLLHVGGDQAYTRLVVKGAGSPDARQVLASMNAERLLKVPVASRDDAAALLAGLWLWRDWLDESHTISQGIDTPTGSFWHAILHRREGDFSNAKYWYARCRRHPALDDIAAQAGGLIRGGWDPNRFVDLVEAVHDQPDDARHGDAVRLQQIEWRTLFNHCLRAAGSAPRAGGETPF